MTSKRGPRRMNAERLHNIALAHLARFATSRANLERVLTRRVARACAHHGEDPAPFAAEITALLDRLAGAGLLDDMAYAQGRAGSLRRKGDSARQIAAKLAAKGVPAALAKDALEAVDDEAGPGAELRAARALARRRRLGPFRKGGGEAERARDLAALARAGFTYEIARKALERESED